MAGNHAVARDELVAQAKVGGPVGDEHIVFFEAAFVEQHLNPFAGGEFAFVVLGIYSCLPSPQLGLLTVVEQLLDFLVPVVNKSFPGHIICFYPRRILSIHR